MGCNSAEKPPRHRTFRIGPHPEVSEITSNKKLLFGGEIYLAKCLENTAGGDNRETVRSSAEVVSAASFKAFEVAGVLAGRFGPATATPGRQCLEPTLNRRWCPSREGPLADLLRTPTSRTGRLSAAASRRVRRSFSGSIPDSAI